MCGSMGSMGSNASLPFANATGGYSQATAPTATGGGALPNADATAVAGVLQQLTDQLTAISQALQGTLLGGPNATATTAGGPVVQASLEQEPPADESPAAPSADAPAAPPAEAPAEAPAAPPAAKPADTPEAGPKPKPATYTVKAGDTLSSIAERAGIKDWHALYEKNKDVIGKDPNVIKPGQVLQLPDGAEVKASRGRGVGGGRGGSTSSSGSGGGGATSGSGGSGSSGSSGSSTDAPGGGEVTSQGADAAPDGPPAQGPHDGDRRTIDSAAYNGSQLQKYTIDEVYDADTAKWVPDEASRKWAGAADPVAAAAAAQAAENAAQDNFDIDPDDAAQAAENAAQDNFDIDPDDAAQARENAA